MDLLMLVIFVVLFALIFGLIAWCNHQMKRN